MSLKPKFSIEPAAKTLDPRLLDLTGTIQPSRHDKVCFVAPDYRQGEKMQRDFRNRKFDHVVVTWPGRSIMGYRFSTILVSDETYHQIQRDQRHVRWWDESLRCRLTLHGQLIVIP
jgi:hypothetical protein